MSPADPPHAPLLAVRALLRAVAVDPHLPVLVVSPRPAHAAAVVRAWLADVAPARPVVHEEHAAGGPAADRAARAAVRVVRRGARGVRAAVCVTLPAVPPVGDGGDRAIFGA